MGKILLLFILVPVLELAILIWIGQLVGVFVTLAIIGVTGALGAFLARRQGLSVMRKMQDEIAAGCLPAGTIVDGVIILLAGAMLITPGILTDAFGFLCLIPVSRNILKTVIRRRIERAVCEKRVHVIMHVETQHGQSSSTSDQETEPKANKQESLPE